MFGKKEKTILAMMGYSITSESQLSDLGGFEFPRVVTQRAQEELKCSDEDMEAITISLLNYFAVVKDEANVEMVDEKADVLWHTLLLDTKAYMDLCSNYIGFYVHHNPYILKKTMSVARKSNLVDNYERSRARHPRLNKRYAHYVDNHRNDDDTLTDLLFFALIMSDSECMSAADTDSIPESNCMSSGAVEVPFETLTANPSEPREVTYDEVNKFNDTPVYVAPESTPEPARESSCSSNCSSSSSSSCSSSSSSSCGSSCGSD